MKKNDGIWEIMMTSCCEEDCFKKLQYVNIKHSQDTFRSLANITEEQNYILNYLKVHVVFGESELLINNISFTIKGVSVCKNASPTIPVMFLTCCTVDIPLNVAKFKWRQGKGATLTTSS